jgi:MFS family permease
VIIIKIINIDIYKSLNKDIYILFISRIISAMGNFIYPFLTLFLTAKLNYSESETGLILLISSILYIPGSIIGGIICDKYSRKNTFVIASILSSIFFMICGLITNRYAIPVLLIIGNMFNGVAQPANTAMVADKTTLEDRKVAFSFLYLGHNLGFAIGPMIAGYLFNTKTNYLFIGNALLTWISVVCVLIFIKNEEKTDFSEEKADDNNCSILSNENSFKLILSNHSLIYFVLISIIVSFIFAQNNFSLPLQLNDSFGEYGPRYYGILMSINACVVLSCTVIITSLTNKFNASLNIALAGLLCSIGFGILYFANSFSYFILSTIIWTFGEILNATNSNVYLLNNTPPTHRGRFNSILSLITGAGYAISPMIMGNYIEVFSVKNSWILVSILGIIVFVTMIYIFFKELKEKKLEE